MNTMERSFVLNTK